MKIAVEGCGHGELDKIYETIQFLEQKEGIKVDLLLCCGDFQSVRNESDLECMAVPKKYRTMNTFYKYYSGEKKAPILTIFIGGNHEASNYLAELPYGGWVCPNIYYMGYAAVVNYGGVRIGGMSGIFKGRDYRMGHHERPPYSQDTVRSAYHIRNLEVFRLQQIKQHMDIMMSHDWPKGIYRHGDKEALLRMKPFFREEVATNKLGSGPTEEVLNSMKPDYWFSAHLHVKFAALIKHQTEDGQEKHTKFLALDKCLPRRDFLQVVDIPHKSEPPFQLSYDPEWLAILKETNHLLSTTAQLKHMPAQFFNDRWDFSVTLEQLSAVGGAFNDDLKVPMNFVKTVQVYNPAKPVRNAKPPNMCINPQTTQLCTKLGITDPCDVIVGSQGNASGRTSLDGNHGDDSVGEDDDDPTFTSFALDSSSVNPDEISLDGGDSDGETATKEEENKERTDACVTHTRGRLSLSLPPVKGEGSSPPKSSDLPIGEISSPGGFSSLPDPSEDLPTTRATSTPFVPRVIKRRNLQVYSSAQEEGSVGDGDNNDQGGSAISGESAPSVGGDKDGQGGSAVTSENAQSIGTEAKQESGGRQMKKIKRRNQAIYTANDDDD